ncbi:Nucleoporin NDC1 [Stylophora pistillata]|uniref:Nucleoporin NDC1 n=1 Tax=Stylophora pistillata TaxID=50429 RepID=A0A2B4SLN0_STYPI|nr:Nucleoporin NDC1 [Stylophora pistillata]
MLSNSKFNTGFLYKSELLLEKGIPFCISSSSAAKGLFPDKDVSRTMCKTEYHCLLKGMWMVLSFVLLFRDNFFKQTNGVAIGTKMGPSYANLFVGNIPRDAIANVLDISLDRNVTPLNSISGLLDFFQFWRLVTTGSLILFVWTFGNKLLVLFQTQYLAFFDLVHLSQFSLTRRKQIFSLSQPSGRPDNWTNIFTECLSLIESLTHKLSGEVSLQTHLQQPVLDPKVLGPALINGHTNGHTGQSSPLLSSPYQSPLSVTRRQQSLSSPGTIHLWSDKTGNTRKIPPPSTENGVGVINGFRGRMTEKVDSSVSKINQIPHKVACRLKETPIIGFLFDKIPEAHTQALFADCQLQIWAVEALSRLVVSSYTEDTYGVVQKSLPKIFISFVNLLQALDQHSKLSLALISKPEIQPRPPQPQGYQLRAREIQGILVFHHHAL